MCEPGSGTISRRLRQAAALTLCLLILASGCALRGPGSGPGIPDARSFKEEPSSAELLPRHEIPATVAQMASVRVFGRQEKTPTPIDLTAGRLYSVMAKGRVFLGPADEGRSPSDRIFVKYIGDEYQGPVFFNALGDTFVAVASGRLTLGINDKKHADNSGYFDAIIVVWNTEDYNQIADFLQQLNERVPGHPGIAQAFMRADNVRDLEVARAFTAQEIGQTRSRLLALKQAPAPKGAAGIEERELQRRELEQRLAELTARQAQLERVGAQLEQERERAARLSQELERERRERERMSRLVAEGKTPPLLLITAPEDGHQSESGSVRLTGAVEDKRGLKAVEIFLNDRPVPIDDARGLRRVVETAPRRINFDRRIQLAEGENLLKVTATNIDELTAERTLLVQYHPKRRNVWAVIIGINDYPRLPKLKYAVNDAQAFYRLMVEDNRVPAENVTLLLDEQAGLVNLRSTLGTRLKNSARENDMVVIFFAGHGATERDASSPDGDGLEKYLLPFDTDPADLYTTAMPMVEVARIFNRIRSNRLVFIADSCYSGASGGRTISVGDLRATISDGFLDRVAGGRGKVIITASSANEVSVEKDELQHGVFTYYLIEGLKGGADGDRDGMVTVDEAYRYVSDKVPQATGQEQHPVRKGSVEGHLVLSIVR
ncbi:MAG: caspase family protein [Desulfobacterales bacterium]|jgi:hypothetical protein|nr:caspase family protein [Desulfobacterales bacterium]